ncbi:hypothetical protein [Actinoallomurus sp. CA-150999]|uniref:hypothetical protein n=1 Tax=Actinoallomurus sp. CA-150999 TaxID=3239887 RepID=UPI003D89FA3E
MHVLKGMGLGREFELRQLADGTGALPVFTDPDLVVAQLGELQLFEKTPVLAPPVSFGPVRSL